jgi:protein-disulfide isomerase
MSRSIFRISALVLAGACWALAPVVNASNQTGETQATVNQKKAPARAVGESHGERFARRLAAYYPGSTYELKQDARHETPTGAYRLIRVDRQCDNKFLTGPIAMLVDEGSGMSYSGAVGKMPDDRPTDSLAHLKAFVGQFLPDALARSMGVHSRVVWNEIPVRAGGVIPFVLKVETGYGEMARPAAVTGDGQYVVLGSAIPFDEDPPAWRKKVLDASDLVVWDRVQPKAPVTIVEFSDFECPGCKSKWPIIKKALEKFSGAVRHGMVNFPLTRIHPWAFRAAVAGWCVAQQDPGSLLGLKEQYYAMQKDMELALVPQVAQDYLSGADMDGAAFDRCYLKPPAVDAVLRQMSFGYRFNIDATPTYFVNGIRIQAPQEDWFLELIQRLLAGEEP